MSGTDKRVAVPAKEGAEHCEAEGLCKNVLFREGTETLPYDLSVTFLPHP